MKYKKSMYILIVMILLLVLPELFLLMSSIDTNQNRMEITFYDPVEFKGIEETINDIKPEYYLAMSCSFESIVNSKKVKTLYSKGNIGYFLNGNYGEILDSEESYISKTTAYELFKTTDVTGLDIIINNKEKELTYSSELSKIDYYDTGVELVLKDDGTSNHKYTRLLLSTKNTEGKNITVDDIKKSIGSASRIKGIARDEIYKDINITRESMKLLLILVLILWIYRNQSVLPNSVVVILAAILVYFIYSMKWNMLPIDLINENLVSLSYLIELVTKVPVNLYESMQTPMTLDTFKLIGISIVQKTGYIIALALVVAQFIQEDKIKKESKYEKSSSSNYDVGSSI